MDLTMPLSFTDAQITQLKLVASMLPLNARDNFLRSIGNRLADLPYRPNDADVQAAIDFVLSCRGVAGGVQAFSNAKSTDKIAAAPARADRCFRTGVSR
jgi:hypothetical protein